MAKRQIRDYIFTPGIAGFGSIKVLDKVQLNQILLINNATKNKLLYNFADPTNQIAVQFSDAYDADFPYANTISNGVTTIEFLFDTDDQDSSDSIQIFVENEEVRFRPYDFGTDAIERMRVATPQSMLDADFEYGIQPTKWQTIDIMRGYPSLYEKPGSDLQVESITTDASTPGGGFGDSLITVNTLENHGFSAGSAIRINGLLETVASSSRAEGSFVVFDAPTSTRFRYYAKGKVGSSNGQSLLTSFIQLRSAEFYTGASIGTPTFTIQSQGSNGVFTSNLITPTGSNRISYLGVSTAVTGAFLTGTGIPSGAQVTGITGFSTTKSLSLDVVAPSNTITVNDNTNNVDVGSAIDDGTGNAIFVTNIVGNTITFSDDIQVNLSGSGNQIGIRTGTPYNFGSGSGALLAVTRNDGRYYVSTSNVVKTGCVGSAGSTHLNVGNIIAVVPGQTASGTGIAIGATVIGYVGFSTDLIELSAPHTGAVSGNVSFTAPGSGYNTQDRLIITGDFLGGTSPENDLIVKVNSVDGNGGITSVTSSKSISAFGEAQHSAAQWKTGGSSLLLNPLTGSVDYLNVPSDPDFGFGSLPFTIEFWMYRNRTGSSEFLVDMRTAEPQIASTIQINSSNQIVYYVNGSILITSTDTVPGSTWTHVAVSRLLDPISGDNTTTLYINGVSQGSAVDNNLYPDRPFRLGARYDGSFGFYGYLDSIRVTKGISRYGEDFTPRETLIPNDAYNVLLIRANGAAGSTSFSDDSKGTAIQSSRFYFESGVASGSGINAQFSIYRQGGASPSYNVNLADPGSGYAPTETITIDGSLLGGFSGINDILITVSTVDVDGGILTFTSSGTASSGNDTYRTLTGLNSASGVDFNINKSGSTYTAAVNSAGSGYFPGHQIFIPGTELGGSSPDNDLVVTVQEVNRESITNTIGEVFSASTSGTPVIADNVEFFPSIALSELTTSEIASGTTISFNSLARILVTFASKHGLVPGDTALVSITSTGTNHAIAAGPRLIDEVPSLNSLVYTARAAGTISTLVSLVGQVYARPDCFYVHRPFDGGVQLGTGGPSHGAHAIRQSKKYLRYQSGKGIMYTTGTLFAPGYDIRSITANGTSPGSVITITTDNNDHGLQIGAEISLSDISTSGYNGHYTVASVIDEQTFTIIATQTLGSIAPTLGTQAQISLYKWKGATVRAGAFDDQNGIFWQYDGVNLAVGLRSATYQLAGTISINADSNQVTGNGTRFQDQVYVGNRIVIRGMTHIVTHVESQTSMTVTPDFRGVNNVSGVKAALVNEIIIPQYQWNIDKADGTGSSGYNIEVNKMQMIGFQYTWYGAGFIDWMLRGPNGDYLFVHRLKNNNRNTEAFMRSGNLPVRYEVINEGAKTRLTQDVGIGSTIIHLDNVNVLPSSGSIYINNEIINYTGIGTTNNTLTGITRSATFTNFYSGSQRSYTAGGISTHSSGTGVVLLSNTATPVISHWGSAFLTDGLFDSDRGYIFNYQSVGIDVSTVKNTAFLIRLAPSVSNAIVGDLGERELINRAQLLLQGIEFTPTGGSSAQSIIIEGILNPQNYPIDPNDISWTSLNSAGNGGQPSFAQIAEGSSVTWVGAIAPVVASNALNQTRRTQYVVFNRSQTANVKQGMTITGNGVPGGTTVVAFFNYDSTRWYIQFSNTVTPGSAGSTSYTFSSPVAALPGETVFSFAGDANQKSSLDLTELKELNNTPIGGRGTFPNGPDVLAINIYSTGGSAFSGSLALRWGEAQA